MIVQLKQLLANTLTTIQSKSDSIKTKLEFYFNKEAITIEDLASFIKWHPETVSKSKQLLDFSFGFYTLQFESIILYLETKDDKILELTVLINEQFVFQYHSYEEQYQITDDIKIPSIVFEH